MSRGDAPGAVLLAAPSPWPRHEAYRLWYERPLGRAYRASIERVLGPWLEAAAAARVGGLAVDAGCGPILTFADLLDGSATLLAVDCSPEMAGQARLRLAELGRRGLVTCGSIDALPIRSGVAHVLLSVNCLEFVKERRRALGELWRIAAPDALLVVGVLHRRSFWEWTRRMRRPFSRAPYYRGRFLTREELLCDLAESGWQVEEVAFAVRFPPLPLPRPELYEVLEKRAAGRPGALLLARCRRATPAG